ncbi:DUF4245 domain-containing protein [Micromonospora lupini]|uniref:DUF4245 domain-containing protein n=1 Tax=Micromonospora lupini str. Lupac 08 TaxID=1150864 RepID=I0KWV6_9ACTN|nr:DUF4245 domain-containing protein [Micromonospora lupini]CCH16053.1 Conserved hypothetical protein [Micromonospora lupini str. Lupac 08]
MDPAQPADRVPADRTPPDGQPPVDHPVGAEPAATGPTAPAVGEPALVAGEPAPAAGAPAPVAGEPALAAGEPAPEAVGQPSAAGPVPGDAAGGPAAAAGTGERPAPPPRVAAAATKAERSPKDMAISLLVLLIPIALLLAFYRGFLGGDQATTVDPAPAIEQARSANTFPVSEPQGLASGWRTVSARYQTVEGGANLRIGYLTPEGRGVQLLQSNVPVEQLLPAELTDQSQPQGPTELAGRTWQRYTARGNQQALVLLEPTRTVLVVGDARDNELRDLAGALR